MSVIPFIFIGIYFAVIIILTLRTPKAGQHSSFEDFYTGSKSMGAIVVALVMMVTYYSGSTWTGWTGFTALNGVFAAYCIPYSIFAGIGMYLLASKIWPLGKEYKLSTLADLYELRYRSTGLKILTGLLGAIMNVTWITMEIVTIGYIIKVATNGTVPAAVGSLIAVILLTAYTLWGGVRSVASVNTFQSVVMVFGAIIVVIALVYLNYGTLAEMFEKAYEVNPMLYVISGEGMQAQWFSFIFLCSAGVLCYPSLYLKMYLGKNTAEIKKAAILNATGGLWVLAFVFAGFAITGYTLVTGNVIDNVEEGLLIILQQTGGPVIFGLGCIFILAACMGTVDGTLLAISGILSSDVIEGFKRIARKAPLTGDETGETGGAESSGKLVRRTRIIVVIIALCAYLITLFDLPLLVQVAMINYQGIAQLFIPLIGALLWKKATRAGTFTSIIASFAVTAFLVFAPHGINLHGFLPGIFGIIAGTILFVVVSLATYKEALPESVYFGKLTDTMKKYA
ncbi:MAG: sodium:solute symporter family protein [Clostridiales Family XIII bacterium]|nr:sodium:solute symporter family protein [Clostridiales Family XIII bacterium]